MIYVNSNNIFYIFYYFLKIKDCNIKFICKSIILLILIN